MIDAKNRPLVSLLIITYRQENYIEEALKSALAQTYRPLQIVVSDDCSPDDTFRLIKKLARDYRGEHELVLHRNTNNLGIAENLNRAWELCRAELVVIQAGDDLSTPDRVEEVVKKWLSAEKGIDLICSSFEEIDSSGRSTGTVAKDVFLPKFDESPVAWRCGATGACAAYTQRIFRKYGPLNPNVISEDWVFPFWAWLEGGVGVVEKPLVKRRVHDESVSVKARNPGKPKNRHLRYEQRLKTQLGSLAIAQEWLKAWRIADKPDKGHRVLSGLEKLVALRQAQLNAFSGSRLNAARMAFEVFRLSGPKLALKTFIRHTFRIY